MTEQSNVTESCFHQEATERSAAWKAALSGATERGSAKMVKPAGLAPKRSVGVKRVGAYRATSFTSHAGFAGKTTVPFLRLL